MANRAGYFKNNLSGDMAYKSFVPNPLPPEIKWDERLISSLIEANSQLAMLDELARLIPDINLFISMYVRKEALLSSQIEGTQATLEDIFDPMIEKNINQDVEEVLNYVKATRYAIDRLDELPLSGRLLKDTHYVLMQGIRGQERLPGEFRQSQNWIGPSGGGLSNARFIPPSPEDLLDSISDLERYMNTKDELDPLVRIALIHYQFETIHPFLDGNGRLGRLLILLILIEEEILTEPILYISYFLKQRRVEYYDRLDEVRLTGNFEQWINFFLEVLASAARDAIETINRIHTLRETNLHLIEQMGRAKGTTRKLYYYLEAHPIIEITQTAKELKLSYNAVAQAIDRLIGIDVLKQVDQSKARDRKFSFEAYLAVLR